MSRKNAWLIGFGAFTLLVIVLIAYFVASHEEAGFSNPDARWDHVPLTVSCRGYVPADDDACSAVSTVVSHINTRLGFTMLERVPGEGGDIEVVMRAPLEVGVEEPGGHALLTGSGNVYDHCEVRTMNVSGGAGDLERVTVYHEIGCHCLGLAHDDVGIGSNNACKPVQQETPSGQIPPWISDSDRALLRERYR